MATSVGRHVISIPCYVHAPCVVPNITAKETINNEMLKCMYVCIDVALCGIDHGKGRSNWAKGRDPSGSWVQNSNHAGTIGPASRTLISTHTHIVCFPHQLLLRAAKGDLHPHM